MAKKPTTPKKAVAKKATARKPVAHRVAAGRASSAKPRQSTAKKATTKKATPKATPKNALKSLTALPKAKGQTASARNQPTNPALPADDITKIADAFTAIREMLEAAAVNLRAKDRERRNGVGIKRQGFIERAFTLAADNVGFLPRYLTLEQFQQSFDYFISLRSLVDSCTQLREFIWNLVVEAADITFVDAGEFYKSVQEAARRRIDGAESIYNELHPFFKHKGGMTEDGEAAETKKKELRDFKALLNNKRDGKMVIENVKPKLSGGTRKIMDEQFKDSEQLSEQLKVSSEK
jgi:hypothetical protein